MAHLRFYNWIVPGLWNPINSHVIYVTFIFNIFRLLAYSLIFRYQAMQRLDECVKSAFLSGNAACGYSIAMASGQLVAFADSLVRWKQMPTGEGKQLGVQIGYSFLKEGKKMVKKYSMSSAKRIFFTFFIVKLSDYFLQYHRRSISREILNALV